MLWFSSYVIVFEFSWKVKEKKNRRHYLLTDPRICIYILLIYLFIYLFRRRRRRRKRDGQYNVKIPISETLSSNLFHLILAWYPPLKHELSSSPNLKRFWIKKWSFAVTFYSTFHILIYVNKRLNVWKISMY